MKELYERPLKVGDLIIENTQHEIKESIYGIVLGENQTFRMSGRIISPYEVYLVEHPCEAELEIKKKLLAIYRDKQVEKGKAKEERKKVVKARTQERNKLVYNVGDVLMTNTGSYTHYKIVYLGEVEFEETGRDKVTGYGYVYLSNSTYNDMLKEIPQYTSFFNCPIIRKKLTDIGRVYDDKKGYLELHYSLSILKKKSKNYDSVIKHIDDLGTSISGSYTVRSYTNIRDIVRNYTLTALGKG